MKLLVLIFLIFSFISSLFAQDGVRELGKVNFLGKSQYVLSASLEKGIITYNLTDIENPETPKKSFKLFSNSFENFKSALAESINEINSSFPNLDTELQKYFSHFQYNNIYYVPDEQGPSALTLHLEKIVSVIKYEYPKEQIIDIDLFNTLISNLIVNSDENMGNNELLNTSPNDYFQKYILKHDTLTAQKFTFEVNKLIDKKKSLTTPQFYKEYFALINHYYSISNFIKLENTYKKNVDTIEIGKRKKEKTFLLKEKTNIETEINLSKETLDNLNNQISKRRELISPPNFKVPIIINILSIEELNKIQFNDSSILETLKDQAEAVDRLVKSNRTIIQKISSVIPMNLNIDAQKELIRSQKIELDKASSDLKFYLNELDKIESIEKTKNDENIILQKKIEELATIEIKTQTINAEIDSLTRIQLEETKKFLKHYLLSPEYIVEGRELQLEFLNGYIENIVLTGVVRPKIPDFLQNIESEYFTISKYIKFTNEFPIGISAKTDIERLYETSLYSKHENEHYELNLSDLINNIEEILALNRKDYSPGNGVETIDLTKENFKELYKSKTKEILELKIFSDFIGISENKPNGLIQLEVDKEIPLLTDRLQKEEFGAVFRWMVNKYANIGFFNFVKPQIAISKIENNQRYLVLTTYLYQETTGVDTLSSTKYGTSSLDLKQFERYILGTDINLLSYDNPTIKSTILINGGIRFGRTDLASNDSVPESNDFPRSFTNTIQPDLEAVWRINGDERFGLEISYATNWIISDQLFFDQRGSTQGFTDYESFKESSENQKLQRITIMAYLNTNPGKPGRLFFRYRANSEFGNWRNNFSQLQLGYSTPLNRKTQ